MKLARVLLLLALKLTAIGRLSGESPVRATEHEISMPWESVLQSIDAEISFFRRRSGQVYFFGLLAEALILVGREKIILSRGTDDSSWTAPPWTDPLIQSVFFVAVAVIGIMLGSEYRRRISFLKLSRIKML